MVSTNILVVEDEKITAMEIQDRLKSFGYSSVYASSGSEAIAKAEEISPDLVLMDIKLKGDMDGVAAAEKIRTSFDIPVIYLTAHSDEKTLERAKITQPFGYMVKPFQERELKVVIEIALYKHEIEKKLKENERWLAAALKSIGDAGIDAVIVADIKGFIKHMNPFAEALTGWKKEEAIGKPLKDVFNILIKETRKQVESPTTKVIREGSFFGLAEHTVLITKGGTEIPIDIIGTSIFDERGDTIGVVLSFYESESKRIEKALIDEKGA